MLQAVGSLRSARGYETRPTGARIREGLFDVLRHSPYLPRIVQDAHVLDLYAGSGALGFEALSRGAARAVFVEHDRRAAAVVKKNVDALGVQQKARLIRGRVDSVIAQLAAAGQRFDLVFMDPPYDAVAERERTFGRLVQSDLVAEGGVIVVEKARKKTREKARKKTWENAPGRRVRAAEKQAERTAAASLDAHSSQRAVKRVFSRCWGDTEVTFFQRG
jgi:16S rRNA (guanine966-N2)-methyltransferase